MRALLRGAGVLLLTAAALSGCAASPSASDPVGSALPAVPAGDEVTVTVFAAASLTGTFTVIARDYEAAHPGTTVALSFAGSSDLVAQIRNGAPADVVATADERSMAALLDDDLLSGDPVDFATNTLEIAVPPGNPAGIASLTDLADDGVATVVCAPAVPCGSAAVAVAAAAGVPLRPISEESSVTDVLGKVRSGEADAGLVYATDVLAAGDAVEGVPFPESSEAVNTYPIATVGDASGADDFVAFVTGAEGRAVLADAGFGSP